jgi:hypothetical protein
MKPEISVVIPNWNGKKFLKTCLDSLRSQSFKDFEIILVDNGSKDESVKFVEENYPEVEIIALKENTGFAKAVNIGIRNAKGNLVALLNNDTEAHPDWLKNLKLAFEKYPEHAFFACKMLCFDQRDIIDSAGDGYSLLGKRYSIHRIGSGQKDGPKFNQFREVFSACGGAAAYRKKLFEKIGLFDEDFFAFCEDIDLSFRAQLAGLRCLYIPSAVVYHLRGATVKKTNYFNEYLRARNEIYLLIKNVPSWFMIKHLRQTIWFNLWWTFKDLIKIITRYKYDETVNARLKGRLSALRNFWKMYKKRRLIQKNRQVSLKYLESILK